MEMSDLKKIGLTEGEIKVYSALLDLGETTRTQLAKKSGISPSKIYDVSNRLIEKGIISSVKKNGVIHFSPANPERIKDFIELKEREIKNEKSIVDLLLPSLVSKYKDIAEKSDVEVLYGWEGMKTAFGDILRSLAKDDVNYVLGASLGKNSEQADTFFAQYFKKVERKGYSVHIIFNENVKGHRIRENYYKKSKKHQVRYLHQDTFAEINVYGNSMLIVLLLEKPVIIKVKGKEAVSSFKTYFKSLWAQAKK